MICDQILHSTASFSSPTNNPEPSIHPSIHPFAEEVEAVLCFSDAWESKRWKASCRFKSGLVSSTIRLVPETMSFSSVLLKPSHGLREPKPAPRNRGGSHASSFPALYISGYFGAATEDEEEDTDHPEQPLQHNKRSKPFFPPEFAGGDDQGEEEEDEEEETLLLPEYDHSTTSRTFSFLQSSSLNPLPRDREGSRNDHFHHFHPQKPRQRFGRRRKRDSLFPILLFIVLCLALFQLIPGIVLRFQSSPPEPLLTLIRLCPSWTTDSGAIPRFPPGQENDEDAALTFTNHGGVQTSCPALPRIPPSPDGGRRRMDTADVSGKLGLGLEQKSQMFPPDGIRGVAQGPTAESLSTQQQQQQRSQQQPSQDIRLPLDWLEEDMQYQAYLVTPADLQSLRLKIQLFHVRPFPHGGEEKMKKEGEANDIPTASAGPVGVSRMEFFRLLQAELSLGDGGGRRRDGDVRKMMNGRDLQILTREWNPVTTDASSSASSSSQPLLRVYSPNGQKRGCERSEPGCVFPLSSLPSLDLVQHVLKTPFWSRIPSLSSSGTDSAPIHPRHLETVPPSRNTSDQGWTEAHLLLRILEAEFQPTAVQAAKLSSCLPNTERRDESRKPGQSSPLPTAVFPGLGLEQESRSRTLSGEEAEAHCQPLLGVGFRSAGLTKPQRAGTIRILLGLVIVFAAVGASLGYYLHKWTQRTVEFPLFPMSINRRRGGRGHSPVAGSSTPGWRS